MKRSRWTAAAWVLGAVVVGAMVLPLPVQERTLRSCAICRTQRVDRWFLGVSWQTPRETEFSRWYDGHRGMHDHLWGREGCTRGGSLFGVTAYYACGRRHPVSDIPEELLLEYCQHADEATLDAYFAGVASPDKQTQHRTVDAVLAQSDLLEGK